MASLWFRLWLTEMMAGAGDCQRHNVGHLFGVSCSKSPWGCRGKAGMALYPQKQVGP